MKTQRANLYMDYIISFKILEIKAKILKCSYKFA